MWNQTPRYEVDKGREGPSFICAYVKMAPYEDTAALFNIAEKQLKIDFSLKSKVFNFWNYPNSFYCFR